MTTITAASRVSSLSGALSWRSHLRICRQAVASHPRYLAFALVFPVLIIILAGSSTLTLISAVIVLALLPTGLVSTAALTGEQLRAFGMGTADQQRHRRMMVTVTAVFSVLAFGLYTAANAVTVALDDGLPWWCLGLAAAAAVVLLVVRAVPTGASDDTTVLRPETATDTQVNMLTVRRTWRPVLWSISALVILQMVVRIVFPDAAQTAMSVLMLAVGVTAIGAGTEQTDLFRTVLVFGGSRRRWVRTVLREGAVLPLVGVVGAIVAVALEKVVVEGLGWADASALVTASSLKDATVIVIAGAATGEVVFLVGMASTLADVKLPGWASIILVMVEAAAVVGLLVAIWAPGADGWQGQWWTLSGGVLVLVLGGRCCCTAAGMARRPELPSDGPRDVDVVRDEDAPGGGSG